MTYGDTGEYVHHQPTLAVDARVVVVHGKERHRGTVVSFKVVVRRYSHLPGYIVRYDEGGEAWEPAYRVQPLPAEKDRPVDPEMQLIENATSAMCYALDGQPADPDLTAHLQSMTDEELAGLLDASRRLVGMVTLERHRRRGGAA